MSSKVIWLDEAKTKNYIISSQVVVPCMFQMFPGSARMTGPLPDLCRSWLNAKEAI